MAAHAVLRASVRALCYDTRSSLLPAMNMAVSAARHQLPSLQALHRPLCHGVSYVTKLLHLEPYPPCVNFIFVWALFKGGVNFCLAELTHVVRDLFKGGYINARNL